MRRYLLLITLVFCGTALASEPLSSEQQEVWVGEEAYWKYIANNDVDGFMTLWDEEFIGWGCGAPEPVNYEELRSAVPAWFADVASIGGKTTIKPEAVMVYEQYAITYVAAQTTTSNESGGADVQSQKMVHTWRRIDDGWKIIGGMCGQLN